MKHLELFENYSSSPYKTDEDIDRDFDMLIAKAEKDREGDLKGEEFSNILNFFMDKLPQGVTGRLGVIRHVVNRLNYEHNLNFKEHEYNLGKEKESYWKPGTKNVEQREKALQMVVDFMKGGSPEELRNSHTGMFQDPAYIKARGEKNRDYINNPAYIKVRDEKYKSYLK
jgi:hypothetical protein